MAEDTRQREVFKFFTGARRIPLMVGRLASGEKIWGGPYKITQFVAGGVAAVAVYTLYNLGVGHSGNLITDLVYGAAIVAGVIFLFGKIPSTKRNLLSMVLSFVNFYGAPTAGRYRGRSFALPRRRHRRRPVAAASARVVHVGTEPPAPAADPAPVPVAVPVQSTRPMSALDALLAQTQGR
jgi:hypothetical protein